MCACVGMNMSVCSRVEMPWILRIAVFPAIIKLSTIKHCHQLQDQKDHCPAPWSDSGSPDARISQIVVVLWSAVSWDD